MHAYSVGSMFVRNRRNWPECAQYNYRGGQHELVVFFASPSPAEVEAVRAGESEFGVLVDGAPLFLLYRFGAQGAGVPWSDAPYSIHLLPEVERVLPPAELAPEARALLHIVLVDSLSGIVRVLRAVSLSRDVTKALHSAIREQAAAPWSPAAYDADLRAAYDRYSTTEKMVTKATRCLGGA